MRRVRYNVAASLDGFLTDAAGAYDWIPDDPAVDFASLFRNVDTYVMGRKTYDAVVAGGQLPWSSEARVYIVSRTLGASDQPGITVVDDPVPLVASLRAEYGSGEIWLFGGGVLFKTLLEHRLVDAVEVTVVPVLLGDGTPLVAPGIPRIPLTLTHSHVYPSGMVALHYDVATAG